MQKVYKTELIYLQTVYHKNINENRVKLKVYIIISEESNYYSVQA